jgi:hypothetical protein
LDTFFGQGVGTKWACWVRRVIRYAIWSAVIALFVAALCPVPEGWPVALARCILLAALWTCGVALFVYLDGQAEKRRVSQKTVKGSRELAPEDFARKFRGDGLGIPYLADRRGRRGGDRRYLRIRAKDEPCHVLIAGDTGAGKSALMHDFLCQIAADRPEGDEEAERGLVPAPWGTATGESVLVYDPALEFWQRHARPDLGDILLHPASADCPYWDLADEIATPLDCSALAMSFLPDKVEGRPDFWDEAPRRILSFLLERLAAEQGTVAKLLRWLADPTLIDEMAEGTTLSPLIDPAAAPQRAGVLATLNKVAQSLRLLPPDDGRARFSFRSWEEARLQGKSRPWVFIGSRPRDRDGLKPLVSAWLDTAFCNLLTKAGGARTWVFVDELPTLQRLPKLQLAVQEARKYNVSFVLGFQGKAQLEEHYGRLAETLMSAPATKIFLRTSEPRAAQWCADAIGRPELERGTETLSTSAGEGRDSVNTGTDRRCDYLVLPNEVQDLDEMTAYLRYRGHVVKFRFDYLDLPDRNVFRERECRFPAAAPQTPKPVTSTARELELLKESL